MPEGNPTPSNGDLSEVIREPRCHAHLPLIPHTQKNKSHRLSRWWVRYAGVSPQNGCRLPHHKDQLQPGYTSGGGGSQSPASCPPQLLEARGASHPSSISHEGRLWSRQSSPSLHWFTSCITILLSAHLIKGLLLQIIHQGEEASSYKTLLFTESTLNHVHTQHTRKISGTGMLKVLSAMNRSVKMIKYRAALA